jgi:hypothetical protein
MGRTEGHPSGPHFGESVKIVIYGLAKSGTSALFYKIRNSLPSGTIELFEPSSYGWPDRLRTRLKALRRGRPWPDVLAKVLPWDWRPVRIEDFERFDRRILLVRDPRDRLVSGLLYRSYNATFVAHEAPAMEFLDLIRKKESEPGRIPVLRLIEAFERLERQAGGRADWLEQYRSRGLAEPLRFHDARPRLAMFRYEDLVDSRFASLEAALDMPLGGSATVPPALERVVRTKRYGAWRHWFTREDVDTLRPAMTPFLDRYYPDGDWDISPSPHLDSAQGSDYVERIVNERRALLDLPPLPCAR